MIRQDIKQSKSLKNNIAGIISEKAKDEILLKKLTNEKEDLNKQQENINENKKVAEKIFIQIQLSLQVEKKQSKVEELKLEQADNLTLLEVLKLTWDKQPKIFQLFKMMFFLMITLLIKEREKSIRINISREINSDLSESETFKR